MHQLLLVLVLLLPGGQPGWPPGSAYSAADAACSVGAPARGLPPSLCFPFALTFSLFSLLRSQALFLHLMCKCPSIYSRVTMGQRGPEYNWRVSQEGGNC